MELRHYLALLRRRRFFILVTVAVAVAAGWLTRPTGVRYSATATVYVGFSQFNQADSPQLSGDRLVALDRVTRTFAIMIRSTPIAQGALEITGLPVSAGSVVAATTAVVQPSTNLIYVTVSDPDPTRAQVLANGVTQAFVDAVATIEPVDTTVPTAEGELPRAPAYIFERAGLPSVPISSSSSRAIFVAGVAGLLVACGLIFLQDYLDITVKSTADVERGLELPVLGVLPLWSGAMMSPVPLRRVLTSEPGGSADVTSA